MMRYAAILCSGVLLLLAQLVAADPAARKGTIAVGYDEGLAVKYFISDKAAVFVGANYMVIGPDTVNLQPINDLTFKGGFEFLIKQYGPLRLNAFIDVQGILTQEEVGPLNGMASLTRTNVWSARGRIGLAPEFFFADHFSLTYRLGGFLLYNGTNYIPNIGHTGTQAHNNDFIVAGVFGDALNLGINIYF